MSRFRKTEARKVPALNTAALPDLIFTLLFFFMIVTHMRPVPIMTQFQVPTASELQSLKEKSLVIYIMVGHQEQINKNALPPIQLNSFFTSLEEMPGNLEEIKSEVDPAERDKMVVMLKIDKETPMGVVNDIRSLLREANLLTVYYAAEKSSDL